MQKGRRPGSSRRSAWKWWFWASASLALLALAAVIVAVTNAAWASAVMGAGWLIAASGGLIQARQLRRRERSGFDEELPAAGDDVLTLAGHGRRIEAIKRYRQANPGVGLKGAKDVVDELWPRQQARTG